MWLYRSEEITDCLVSVRTSCPLARAEPSRRRYLDIVATRTRYLSALLRTPARAAPHSPFFCARRGRTTIRSRVPVLLQCDDVAAMQRDHRYQGQAMPRPPSARSIVASARRRDRQPRNHVRALAAARILTRTLAHVPPVRLASLLPPSRLYYRMLRRFNTSAQRVRSPSTKVYRGRLTSACAGGIGSGCA